MGALYEGEAEEFTDVGVSYQLPKLRQWTLEVLDMVTY